MYPCGIKSVLADGCETGFVRGRLKRENKKWGRCLTYKLSISIFINKNIRNRSDRRADDCELGRFGLNGRSNDPSLDCQIDRREDQ